MLFTSTHPHVLMADVPTTANWWNQAKCPSMSKWINKTRNTVQQPGAKHGHTPALGRDTWCYSPTGRFRMCKLRQEEPAAPRAEQGWERGWPLTRLSRPAHVGGIHALLP